MPDQDAIEYARPDISGDAHARPSTSGASRDNWLTVEEAVAKFERSGVSRKMRTVQKYCLNGKLTCHQAITEIGVRYFIDPASIDAYVATAAQMAPIGTDTSSREGEWSPPHENSDEMAHASCPVTHAPASIPSDERYVGALERENELLRTQLSVKDKQLELKDKQIDALIERDKETNVLIQGLQRMMLPPAAENIARGDSRRSVSHLDRPSASLEHDGPV